MRKILFRGKDIKTNQWFYGDLQQNIDAIKLREQEKNIKRISKSFIVKPETVGQYTGLKDKNGKRIFEGDILRNPRNDLFVVRYICGGFDCEPIKEFYKKPKISWNTLGELQNASWVEDNNEVIGNIYDNSNLLPMDTK